MTSTLRTPFLVLAAATLVAGALALGGSAVGASGGGTCAATMAGLETSRKTPVELVTFNSTTSEITLDLQLLDGDGNTVLDRPAGLVVGPFQTRIVSLEEELSRDLDRKEKPYEGLVAVRLSGDTPFASDTVIVHATQYFGKRKRPKGAVVFRPLFQDVAGE